MNVSRLGCFAALATLGVFSASCNDHVFNVVQPACHDEQQVVKDLDFQKPADILVVLDNSGSMCEEQQNLSDNFFNPACPINDINNIDERYLNPSDQVLQTELANCGFVQILAAYQNDFRLGVITTDVGPCDNRNNYAGDDNANLRCGDPVPDWGRRPQRGCLQPPQNAERRFLQRGDVDIGTKFTSILQNTRTYGSGFERGLDAMKMFLDGDTLADECASDSNDFIRDDAKLIVIFVTDEDDCSHGQLVDIDGNDIVDEFSTESCDNPTDFINLDSIFPQDCYALGDQLTPVSVYADHLKAFKGPGRELDVSVALIGGALRADNGAITPAGCIQNANGNPASGCFESGGQSNNTFQAASPCAAQAVSDRGGEECCQADPGTRYFQLGEALGGGQSLADSICYESFRETMINVAGFIARTDLIQLQERPTNEGDIVVRIIRENGDVDVVDRIPDGEDTTDQNGFQYDPASGVEIRLYGTAVGQPGDRVSVAAPVTDENAACGEAAN